MFCDVDKSLHTYWWVIMIKSLIIHFNDLTISIKLFMLGKSENDHLGVNEAWLNLRQMLDLNFTQTPLFIQKCSRHFNSLVTANSNIDFNFINHDTEARFAVNVLVQVGF